MDDEFDEEEALGFRPLIGVTISNLSLAAASGEDLGKSFRPLIGVTISNRNLVRRLRR